LGDHGKYRYGDFFIKKSGKHIWVFRADTLPLVYEIKAFYRKDKSWKELIVNAAQQVFNHTSRYLRVGLNFAGAGVNSHATGVIGSLAYIQVYALRLTNVGTPVVDVECVKSDLLPLMSKTNFKRWVKANHRDGEEDGKSEIMEAERTLYPCHEKEDNVPYGLLLMLQLMLSSKSELFGQTLLKIGDDLSLLASGTFGNVFLMNDDTVLKLSWHGRASYLKAEGLAYKAVGHYGLQEIGKGRCQQLAVAENKKEMLRIGSVNFEMEALTVRPAGTPLLRAGILANEESILCDVVFDVALALQHMHKYGVAHNDISIANVIVVKSPQSQQGSRKFHAVLVDLSLASPFTVAIPIFVGNPTYVHRDIHQDKEWYPRPFHDMTALGFLAAVLAAGSIVPWEGFSSPTQDTKKHNDRLQKANGVIDANLTDNECKSQIKKWIGLDETETILRKNCSCTTPCSADNGCKCAKLQLQCLSTCNCTKTGKCGLQSSKLPAVLPVAMDTKIYERISRQHHSMEGQQAILDSQTKE
jgi:hypothetical protein